MEDIPSLETVAALVTQAARHFHLLFESLGFVAGFLLVGIGGYRFYACARDPQRSPWTPLGYVVAGVSLVTNYRGTFNETIQSSGLDGLVKLLKEKNQSGHGEVKIPGLDVRWGKPVINRWFACFFRTLQIHQARKLERVLISLLLERINRKGQTESR